MLTTIGMANHERETGKSSKSDKSSQPEPPAKSEAQEKLTKRAYKAELYRLQAELVKVQAWMQTAGARIVIIFEGRDAAGKGGTIKRVTQYLNPRVAQIAALPKPSERQRGEWYFQRYIEHLPAAGEMTLFDRSWY